MNLVATITTFIFLFLIEFRNPGQNNINRKLNTSTKMEWDDVDRMLRSHIQKKVSLENGIGDIKALLSIEGNEFLVSSINSLKLKIEFRDFLQKTLRENPLPKEIQSICFGLFTMSDKGKELATVYLCGSTRTPINDSLDWPVDPAYFPRYYLVPEQFETANKVYHDLTGDQEVLVFNGIINLLIINTIEDFKDVLLKNRDSLFVGAGFDAGDTYVLGKISKDGLK